MQLGMVGLGRMGSGMTKRLEQHGHELKTYDPNVGSTAKTLRALAKQLDAPRHIWLMVPSGKVTEDTFQKLLDIVEPGDTIVDGGNSNFRDSKRRYAEARKRKVAFVDVGVSGGIWGLEVGFCLMAGGDKAPVKRLRPVFEALLREGAIVRPLHGFGAPTAIRVTVGTSDEHAFLDKALGRVLVEHA